MSGGVTLGQKILSIPMDGLKAGAQESVGVIVGGWISRAIGIEKLIQKYEPDFEVLSIKDGLFIGVFKAVVKMQSRTIVLIDKETTKYQETHKKAFNIAVIISQFITYYAVFQCAKRLGCHNISDLFIRGEALGCVITVGSVVLLSEIESTENNGQGRS